MIRPELFPDFNNKKLELLEQCKLPTGYPCIIVALKILGAPELSYRLLDKNASLGDIIKYEVDNIQKLADDLVISNVFLALDSEAKLSPGKRSALVGNIFTDGQILYCSYIYIQRGEYGKWQKGFTFDPTLLPMICSFCNKPKTETEPEFRYAVIGFSEKLFCNSCLHSSLLLGVDEPVTSQLARGVKTFTCAACGSKGAGLTYSNELKGVVSQCPNKCPLDSTTRICKYCEIPIETRLTCGRCGNVCYCSKDCQTKDWLNHKGQCQ